jgi:hypothetical protein
VFDINKFHPIELDDLVRIGNKYDGGYVLSQSQIEKTETLLSFGINTDWTFEESFYRTKNVKILSYDYSTKARLDIPVSGLIYRFLYSVAGILCYLLLLKPARTKDHLRRICLKSNFYKFFDGRQGKHFIPKFIGGSEGGIYTCFDTIFRELGAVDDLSVFIKMDIEGGEYESLPRLGGHLNKINGIAVEFHNLVKYEKEFVNLTDDLADKFYVAHIHGCNYGHLIEKTNIPDIIKITFINKRIAPGNIRLSGKHYPVKGLDFPDDPLKKDYVLKFDR